MQDGDNDYMYVFTRSNPHMITQIELNDLICDLNLSKEKSEILGSRLQEWNLLIICSFRYHMKYLGALAFVPVEDVIPTYEIILHSKFYTENMPILSSFLQYYEETWIGIKVRSRRRIPFFQLSTWNVFEAVANRWARTNNNCKGFHRGFSSLLSGYHPSTIFGLL